LIARDEGEASHSIRECFFAFSIFTTTYRHVFRIGRIHRVESVIRRAKFSTLIDRSNPMLPIHSATKRAYCLVVMPPPGERPGKRKSPGFFGAALDNHRLNCRVVSLSSNLTGRPVFLCRTVARSTAYPPGAMFSSFSATTSQPRSLLSMAKLNIAKSRRRPSI
jgi:hypothetical protein